MLAAGSPIYILIPSATNQRALRPGKVTALHGVDLVAEFEEPIALEAGAEVIIYHDYRGKFFQRGATVAQVRQTEPLPVIEFQCVGDAVSAESRQTFRVAVAMSGILAQIDKERKCQIVDLSPEGFAAIVPKELRIGTMVRANLTLEGQEIDTLVRVQTLKKLPSGKLRYGFLVPEKKNPARAVLEKVTALFQRAQLRRLSGAAA